MSLMCGFIQSIWTKFYNTCVRNVPDKTRYTVGACIVFASILIFILSTKGSKKGDMVGSWFLFFIAMIALIAGVVYLSL